MPVVLGQSGNRDIEPQGLEHLVDHPHLPLASVGDDQIGEFGPLSLQTAVATIDHLAHRGVIVRSDHGFDVEVAVLLARRLSVAEDHARGDGMGPLQVRIVEALDMAGRPVETQRLLQGVHQPLGMPLGVADLQILQLLGPVDARALLRELQQFEFLAPLGYGEGHTVEEQRGRGQEGDDHLAGQHPAADLFDDVLDGQRQHVPLVGPDARRELHGRDAHH